MRIILLLVLLFILLTPVRAQVPTLGRDAQMPAIVGNEQPLNDMGQPSGWIGMTGRCPQGDR